MHKHSGTHSPGWKYVHRYAVRFCLGARVFICIAVGSEWECTGTRVEEMRSMNMKLVRRRRCCCRRSTLKCCRKNVQFGFRLHPLLFLLLFLFVECLVDGVRFISTLCLTIMKARKKERVKSLHCSHLQQSSFIRIGAVARILLQISAIKTCPKGNNLKF